MSQEIISAIIGSGLIIACGAIGYILTKVFSMDGRLIRMETFVELMGKNLAQAMHSPSTPEFDHFADLYSKNHELSWDEWKQFRDICLELQKHDSPHPHKISGYAVLAALCEHKLQLPDYTKTPKYPRLD